MRKNIKTGFLLILLVFFAFSLSGCGKGSPSIDMLKKAIPQNLLEYYINNETYKFNKESFSLIRQKTDGKTDYAECALTQAGTYLDRDLVLGFNSNYYDKGGWQVDSCYIVKTNSEEYHDLKPLFIEAIKRDLVDDEQRLGEVYLHKGSNPTNYSYETTFSGEQVVNVRFSNQFDVVFDSDRTAKADIDYEGINCKYCTINGHLATEYRLNKSNVIEMRIATLNYTYDWSSSIGYHQNPPQDLQLIYGNWHIEPDWSFIINSIDNNGNINATIRGKYGVGFLTKRYIDFEKTVNFTSQCDNNSYTDPSLHTNEQEIVISDTDGTQLSFKVQLFLSPYELNLYSNNPT